MENFIDPFDALPGSNMLCECIRSNTKSGVFQARLVMNTANHGNFMWIQPNGVMSSPQGLYWRYVIFDELERRKEAEEWFKSLSSQLRHSDSIIPEGCSE